MLAALLAVQAWILANPVLFGVIWGAVTGLASLLIKKADQSPTAHAVLSFLAGIGFDVPKSFDAIKRLIAPSASGGGGSAAAVVTSASLPANPPAPSSPPSPALQRLAAIRRRPGLVPTFAQAALLFALTIGAGANLAVGVSGCTAQQGKDAKGAVDTAIDVAPFACLAAIAVEDLVKMSDEETRAFCKTFNALAPTAKDLFDKLAGARRQSAGAAHQDAGSDAAKKSDAR